MKLSLLATAACLFSSASASNLRGTSLHRELCKPKDYGCKMHELNSSPKCLEFFKRNNENISIHISNVQNLEPAGFTVNNFKEHVKHIINKILMSHGYPNILKDIKLNVIFLNGDEDIDPFMPIFIQNTIHLSITLSSLETESELHEYLKKELLNFIEGMTEECHHSSVIKKS